MVFTPARTTYLFKGQLCGLICSECPEPLSIGKVRLYRTRQEQNVPALAVADPKDTFAILTDEAVDAKAKYLLAEVTPDAEGRFTFELGAAQNYHGEAFDIDFECGTVPHRKPFPRPHPPIQFSITTLQPQWRQARQNLATVADRDLLVASWDYCIPSRYWCAIRARFGAWTICGRVVDCQTKIAIADVKVFAFDTDIFQDDALGSATTDASGKFRIDYTTEDFQKTPLSPFINFEIFSGPDLYFRIETPSGTILLDEPRLRGRQPDRGNVSNCFCVELCIDSTLSTDNPIFTHVGHFNKDSAINPATGRTKLAILGHGGPDYGFFNDLSLRGYCPATLPGDPSKPMRYRFSYVHPSDPTTEVRLIGDLILPTIVGVRPILWDTNGDSILESTYQDIYVAGSVGSVAIPADPTIPPPHVIVPDADGWVTVDPNVHSGRFGLDLMRFNSPQAVPGGAAPENGAGVAPSAPQNGTALKLIFEAGTVDGTVNFPKDELAKIYINNWNEVRQANLAQFQAPGADSCSELTTALDILYTVDHELISSWSLGIGGASPNAPGQVLPPFPPVAPDVVPPLPPLPTVRGGAGKISFNISSWASCSYTVTLASVRRLTNGLSDDDTNNTTLTFCK
ncbi:MAG: hypothetical protein KME16_13825 [Scytolyngbya sp. HA4215-MV1]|nr:hypothetical protein [Scytolyngbya sp. HA4215-MV1]